MDSMELSDVGFSYEVQEGPLFWRVTQKVKKGDGIDIFGESGN